MQKSITCCDICEAEIFNYDPEKDCIKLTVPSNVQIPNVDTVSGGRPPVGIMVVTKDICLKCLARIVTMEHKVAGNASSSAFLSLIEKSKV